MCICTGVLTYCSDFNALFSEWQRVLKQNGLIIVSHRSDIMKNDEIYFNQMEEKKYWKKLYRSDPAPYLPNNENYGNSVTVEYYVAQKI